MSLITRCPECQTLFRVVPDQLRLSEGWVRCGYCEAVFDASANLNDGLQDEVVQETGAAASTDPTPTPSLTSDVSHSVDAPEPLAFDSSAEPILVSVDEDEIRSVSRPVQAPELPPDVTFIQQPVKSPARQRPWAKGIYVFSGLMLALVLVLQIVLADRDRIAAIEPALKPMLVTACEVFQCEVRPLQQIESIVIESSSFNKIRGDVYRLTLTLKNTANTTLAAPAIELSLTDMQDQPLMRRVFQPSELGNAGQTISGGSESVGTLALSIKTIGATDRIAGYRVLAFYP